MFTDIYGKKLNINKLNKITLNYSVTRVVHKIENYMLFSYMPIYIIYIFRL